MPTSELWETFSERLKMRFLIVAVLLCSAVLAQNPPAPGKPAQPAPATGQKVKTAQPTPDQGVVNGSTYNENFFNLTCSIPEGWTVKTSDMRTGLAKPESSFLLLSAFSRTGVLPGQVNSSLTITAENLTDYPEVKSAEDYLALLGATINDKGFTVLNPPAEIEVGGVTFVRADFQKEEGEKTVYQASMVAIRKGYALAITAISGSDEELTPLLNRVRVFAPPTLNKQP